MNRGGLCDVCIDPGHCCRDLPLRGGPTGPHGERVDQPMSFERAEHMAMRAGLPFRPIYRDEEGLWRWTCTALDQRTGRCTIYETRPQVCQIYDPGTDPLCVHHVPRDADSGEQPHSAASTSEQRGAAQPQLEPSLDDLVEPSVR
ncbi:YkgJ family cysteine cluster protein [Sphingomonas sp.]|uniref:YkgJ family cysteine cluster protein n=1 Tax=Sphingomonas sp. TaxID=28214 RepID=UPI003BACBE49